MADILQFRPKKTIEAPKEEFVFHCNLCGGYHYELNTSVSPGKVVAVCAGCGAHIKNLEITHHG